ncbi:PDR/VanB family oxidoreductase [uncultured Paraglaciecola sp.]|uniref:PDR/VanB family oxidoreductase n=1 Tax=uncultured Paraglaciecola sp. TaxID=1765024 RepID=UPI0030D7DDE9|tara:strand:+ start:529373 stop:530338 length:966 start_codon:yes stop_codon:yes gene_type:complete
MMTDSIDVNVHCIWQDGEDVRLFDLRPKTSQKLTKFSAGAHIDVHTGNELTRQYSLCNHPDEQHRYVIAVALASDSKGGSLWLHEEVKEGDILSISLPRNHFPLADEPEHSVLIAGGIGITPILTMAYTLEQQGKSWELHFTARNEQQAPLLTEIKALQETAKSGVITTYYTRDSVPNRIDFNTIVNTVSKDSNFYCCGPTNLLQSYSESLANLPSQQVHLEHFQSENEAADEGGYTLVLARSGKELLVPEGKTVLQVLKENSVGVTYACAEGVCGSCEVPVISGLPDHRDMVLSDAEKSENATMMVCCSGSLSSRLVLDL